MLVKFIWPSFTEQQTITMVMDVSGSMRATDVDPTA